MTDSQSTTIDLILKVLFWSIPLIFTLGMWYSTSTATGDEVAKNADRISSVEAEVEAHKGKKGHDVTNARVKQIEEDVTEIRTEQRVIRTEQKRASENISAICQATNAKCR